MCDDFEIYYMKKKHQREPTRVCIVSLVCVCSVELVAVYSCAIYLFFIIANTRSLSNNIVLETVFLPIRFRLSEIVQCSCSFYWEFFGHRTEEHYIILFSQKLRIWFNCIFSLVSAESDWNSKNPYKLPVTVTE